MVEQFLSFTILTFFLLLVFPGALNWKLRISACLTILVHFSEALPLVPIRKTLNMWAVLRHGLIYPYRAGGKETREMKLAVINPTHLNNMNMLL